MVGRREGAGLLERAALLGTGFVAGVGFAFFFDPRRGTQRRHQVRDQSAAAARHALVRMQRRSADLEHRLRGALHEARASMQEERVPDAVLVERVRAQLGRPVSHPGLLDVEAQNGHVRLYGAVLAHEVDDLVLRLVRVRGVRDIESQLVVCETPEEIDRLAGRRGGAPTLTGAVPPGATVP